MDKQETSLLRIELSYAVFGVILKDGCCIEAAPIAKWMIGKTKTEIEKWVQKKGGKCQELE